MTAPRSAPPEGYATWLDYHLEGPNSVHDGWRFARAELAELRERLAAMEKERNEARRAYSKDATDLHAWLAKAERERDELREAVLGLGMLSGYEHNVATTAAWNRLVAKLRAEATKEPKA